MSKKNNGCCKPQSKVDPLKPDVPRKPSDDWATTEANLVSQELDLEHSKELFRRNRVFCQARCKEEHVPGCHWFSAWRF